MILQLLGSNPPHGSKGGTINFRPGVWLVVSLSGLWPLKRSLALLPEQLCVSLQRPLPRPLGIIGMKFGGVTKGENALRTS